MGKKEQNDNNIRFKEIELVKKEREALVRVSKELLTLLHVDNPNEVKIEKKILELTGHLANIGGFCDKDTREKIHEIKNLLTFSIGHPAFYVELKLSLPHIVGIEVDFTKRPFKIIGFELEVLKQKFKALLKR